MPDDSDAGSIELSPVLKRHNAYMVHNETIYCQEVRISRRKKENCLLALQEDEWRGDYSCLKVKLHFTRDKFFYMTTVFIPGVTSPGLETLPVFIAKMETDMQPTGSFL